MNKRSKKLAINSGEKATPALPTRFHFDNAIATGNTPSYNDPKEETFCKEFAEFMGTKYVNGTNGGPIQINREKNQRRWTVQGNISGRSASHIVADMRQVIAEKVALPPGYFVEFGGQFENQERVMRKLAVVVPLVIAMIFMLLWGSFKSLRSATIVITNVPLALIGGVIGLWMTGQALSVPAAVGFIALLGIAMQDGVVMVSEFDELRRSGTPLQEAIFHGSEIRFRSVILTTLTTLLGLLPLLLSQGIGAEVQRPLAAIVIFGLSSSTLLTLFVLPSLYYEVERRFIK